MDNCSELLSAEYSFRHQHLLGKSSFSYTAEKSCYMNILSSDCSEIITYSVADKSFILYKGSNILHYLEEGMVATISSLNEGNQLIVVFISPSSLRFFHSRYQSLPQRFADGFATKSDARIRLLLEQLYQQHQQSTGNTFHKMRQDLILLEIILHQIETLAVESDNQQIIVIKNHYDKILLAKQIIEEDLSKNHSIPELAKLVGTNVQYLKKYFKLYFGKTVMNYITEKKMEHAKELILTGNLLVSDVARMTGYKHSTHFTTAFKKHFGFIPNSLKYSFLVHQSVVFLSELDSFLSIL